MHDFPWKLTAQNQNTATTKQPHIKYYPNLNKYQIKLGKFIT